MPVDNNLEIESRAVVVLNRTIKDWAWGLSPPPALADSSGGDKHYQHTQSEASNTWTIRHNLGKFPAITVVDSAGTRWIGTEIQKDSNTAILQFAFPFSGIAYCN